MSEYPDTSVAPAKGLWLAVLVFGGLMTPLMLTGPLFMLQVYDRVLPSASEPTLLILFALVCFVYITMALLDAARARLMLRIGGRMQAGLEDRVMAARERALARDPQSPRGRRAVDDLDTVNRALISPALLALFDTPWAFLFLSMLFLFHPAMGILALGGAGVLIAMGAWGRWRLYHWQMLARDSHNEADALAHTMAEDPQMIAALGMGSTLRREWGRRRRSAQEYFVAIGDRQVFDAAGGRAFRLFMQSAILALGGWLVIRGQLSPGLIVAATVLLGRALAPVEQVSANWTQLQAARRGWQRLQGFLAAHPATAESVGELGTAGLVVQRLLIAVPGSGPILRLDSLQLRGGQALGVIGPTGAGKSVMAQAILGVMPLTTGQIHRGTAGPDGVARPVGYLPQRAVLFPGTVAQNIARFDPKARFDTIIEAARLAGLHEYILRLHGGYQTMINAHAEPLPHGIQQRIALARAFFGFPALVVLDEPNAHLDSEGVAALNEAIRTLKAAGSVVIVMAHRPAGIAECDQLLVLDKGVQTALGPRDQVARAALRNHETIAFPQAKGIAK